jgi:integrase
MVIRNDTISDALYKEFDVKRGLRDINGKGVVTGLTNISEIYSFQEVDGKRVPCDGELWYRGYNIRELVKKYTAIALNTTRKGGYSPHKLRATAATSLIGRGNSIFDVAALLDHEQVTTTQLYARQKMNVKRDLVKDMEWEEERLE